MKKSLWENHKTYNGEPLSHKEISDIIAESRIFVDRLYRDSLSKKRLKYKWVWWNRQTWVRGYSLLFNLAVGWKLRTGSNPVTHTVFIIKENYAKEKIL